MIGLVAAFFAKPAAKYGAIALLAVALLLAGFLGYHTILSKGEKAGKAEVITEVQGETIKAIEGARTEKEKANEAVRNTPLDALVDGLR